MSHRHRPLMPGMQVVPGQIRGYYVDLRSKSKPTGWPPAWLRPGKSYVAVCQWGLGSFERYLAGEGEQWLAWALDTGRYLLSQQSTDGLRSGGWEYLDAHPHTFRLKAPWLSAMAQGQGASLFLRLHRETGEERFLDAASRALQPLKVPVADGGVLSELNGWPFPEEYPTTPSSFVLNGAFFALWGYYDLALAANDRNAYHDFERGVDMLIANLHRWDTGYWSRYDLYPHPIPHVASWAYHVLHMSQLQAMDMIAPRPTFSETLSHFQHYAAAWQNRTAALMHKVAFRLLVPRNSFLAARLRWPANMRVRG